MAKLTEAEAVKLLGRLSRTARFPEEKGELKALARTLMQAAPEREMAAKVIEELRRACEFCPSDAEVFRIANSLRVPVWKGSEICRLGECDGSGWVPIAVKGVEGVKACRCRGSEAVSTA